MRYIIFDTETTGVGPDKEAVEFAMLEIDVDSLEILGAAQSLVMPTGPISEEAQAIHGISLEMLQEAQAPCIEDWVTTNMGGRFDDEVVLMGHRVGFDKPLFAPFGEVVATLDTLSWAFELWPEAPNKKLDTLKEYLSLEGGGQSHRAMADALTCHQLLRCIVDAKGMSLHDLVHTRFTVHYMPWGKHQGKRLMEVPRTYRQWMLTLPDLDPNLRMSCQILATLDPPPLTLRTSAKKSGSRIFIPRRKSK